MNQKIRNVLLVLAAIVFLGSGTLLLRQLIHYQAADRAYDTAEKIAVQDAAAPTPTPAPELPTLSASLTDEPEEETATPEALEENVRFLLDLDLNALRATNEDVLGWICVPDSEISYPLIEVTDNNEYLRRSWDGAANQAGCIFLECRNQHDLSDFNTLIYGHYMRNGTMFGSLHNYREREYWDSHPYIYIVTDEGVRRYQVFSAYEADVVSDTYRLYFEDDARKQAALDYYAASSVAESGLVPTVDDHVLTLSTCMGTGTYDTRWVVQAVLNGEFSRADA